MADQDKIWQEIHCPKSGGGCGGYVLVKLNRHLNYRAIIVCPSCKHEHTRCVQNGHVIEEGRFDGQAKEYIRPTMGAWSKEPRTKNMVGVSSKGHSIERTGAIITDTTEFVRQPNVSASIEVESNMMRELWEERFAGGE